MDTADTPEVVRADRLGFSYRSVPVLDQLSFVLRDGVTGLVGVNGAGKSTLLRILATTLTPEAGALALCGFDAVDQRSEVRRRIGFMPQSLQIPAQLRVDDFLSYVAWLRGFERSARPALVEAALVATDLESRARAKVGTLSGGTHRRLLLAQAVLGTPEVLLLDEPTAGLDPEQRIRVRQLIARAAASRATVVSSHLMEDLVPVADHVLMIDEGRIAFSGSVDEMAAIGAQQVLPDSGLSIHEAAFLSLCARGRVG